MRGHLKVRELMQREGLRGEIVQLFHVKRTGMIHGDNGYDVTFNEESLAVGLSYQELGLGLRVSYGIFFAAGSKVPTAINVQPIADGRTETTQEGENPAAARADGLSVV